MLDHMQGVISHTTIKDYTGAMFYQAAANNAAQAGTPVVITKLFHILKHCAASISCFFSINNNQTTHFIGNKFSLPSFVTEKKVNKNRSGSPQKLITNGEVMPGNTLKGFLNIFTKRFNELAAISKNNQKKGVNYYNDQPQNDLLLMCLNRVPNDAFVVARQEAIDQSNHFLNMPLCQGNTRCITHNNNSINSYFFFTGDDYFINRKFKAAHGSLKLSTHYYVSEKPILKKRPEPPLP